MSSRAALGPLTPLLADPAVTDVVVHANRAWLDRGAGLERTTVHFDDDVMLRRLAQRLAAACDRRLDDAQPWVDAQLPDGTRLHAILPPLTSSVSISLRVFRRTAFTVEDLINAGTLCRTSAQLLGAMVRARLSYIVTGGTASGKTTLLTTLLSLVPTTERVVIAEDVTELRPAHPHVVSLQTRLANSEGAGAVTLQQLVRQALRMRPDRIVVGECRGPEVIDLLAALNTGHEGSTGTLHANSPADVPARFAALAAPGGLSVAALREQLAAGLHCVVQLRRIGGRRRLAEIAVVDAAAGRLRIAPAWRHGESRSLPGQALLTHWLAAAGLDLAS